MSYRARINNNGDPDPKDPQAELREAISNRLDKLANRVWRAAQKHSGWKDQDLEDEIMQLFQAHQQQLLSELLDYGSWLKDRCDLHEKYTSACCGCQRAKHALFEVENYKGYLERKIGELNG